MDNPVALRLNASDPPEVYRVAIDPAIIGQFHTNPPIAPPALLVVRKAAILPAVSAGLIDGADIILVQQGDWARAILVVLPQTEVADSEPHGVSSSGDREFIADVERNAPELVDLAVQTISAIRAAGIDGELTAGAGGRWVNRPLNTFTLKVQPRVGNLAFTLYGNPETYNYDKFLLKDQNSYSRGWVRSSSDVAILADLVRQSHARRRR
jgi:hypothetical protein